MGYREGQEIVVRFGSFGTQRAIVVRDLGERLWVKKWRAHSQRWTQNVWIHRSEIVTAIMSEIAG